MGIATERRAGRSGIESWWGRDFPPFQTGPGAYPVSCKMGTGSFPGVKCGRGVLLTTHSFSCCGNGRVELYLYPPSGPHRACNGINLPFFTFIYERIYRSWEFIYLFIYCNWVVARWKWLFTCKQNTKLFINKFKSGGLHEKHVVATWNFGNHLSIFLQAQGNQEKPVSRSRLWAFDAEVYYDRRNVYGYAVNMITKIIYLKIMLAEKFHIRNVKVTAWNYDVIYIMYWRNAWLFTELNVVLSIGYE